uniref:Uncharacterized protein n=1 Tax=Brassica oleracea var. oleracea TaxID=109376 RepID=A0A0D3AL30_BRAOL
MLLKLGMLCSKSNPENRPSMRHIVQYLKGNVPVPSISFDTTGFGMPNISNETPASQAAKLTSLKPSLVSGFEHHMALIIESEISFAKLHRRSVTVWDHIFFDHIFSDNIFSDWKSFEVFYDVLLSGLLRRLPGMKPSLKMNLPELPPKMFTLGEESAAIRSISYHSDDTKLFKALCDCLTADEYEDLKASKLGVFIKFKEFGFGWTSRLVHFILCFQLDIKKKFDQQETPMYTLSQSSDPPARLGDNSLPIEVDDDEDEEHVMNQELDEHLFNSTESF